jgi:hypothetical protein
LEEKEHGVNQLRVIGGVCDCCLKAGMQFYNGNNGVTNTITGTNSSDSNNALLHLDSNSNNSNYPNKTLKRNDNKNLGIPMHAVSKVEASETTKIVENAHRYLQIAFAEELYLYCQENNMSFSELRDALNTKWNVNILEPREGIGGHCLPKDTKMFLQSSKNENKILTAAMQVDEEYRKFRSSLERDTKFVRDIESIEKKQEKTNNYHR